MFPNVGERFKRRKRQCPNTRGRPQRRREPEAAHPLAGGRSGSKGRPRKEEEDTVATEEILLMDLSEAALQAAVVGEADKYFTTCGQRFFFFIGLTRKRN